MDLQTPKVFSLEIEKIAKEKEQEVIDLFVKVIEQEKEWATYLSLIHI